MQTFKIEQIETLKDRLGYNLVITYFIRDGDDGPIKIGRSNIDRMGQRLSGLQIGNPRPLNIVGVIVGDCEVELHAMFKKYKISGEWFKPNANLIAYIVDHREKLPRVYNRKRW